MPTAIAEFVAKRHLGSHPNCWTCSLSDVEDLNTARRAGVAVSVLCAYLSEEKQLGDATSLEGKLRGHFRRGHHLDGKAYA